jgi:O-antigen ligase
MAKKRRLNKRSSQVGTSAGTKRQQELGAPGMLTQNSQGEVAGAKTTVRTDRELMSRLIDPMNCGIGLLACAVVHLAYYPSDSVAVEQGDALWFGLLAVSIATVTWAGWFWQHSVQYNLQHTGDSGVVASAELSGHLADGWSARVLNWAPWLLAAWMVCAAFVTCPPGNLRMATNESWLWVSAAAIFSATRLLTSSLGTRRALLTLFVICTVGLSVHGLHQYFITLPANRLMFQQDPDKVLALAGINAPPGSSERMVFANRLIDGGPTATFALANSLAAILLFGVVLAAGVLRYRFRVLGTAGLVLWVSIALLCLGSLLAARSRSATLAMVVAIGLLWLSSGRLRRFRSRALIGGLGLLVAVSVGGALFLGFYGNREWFEQAPASLAFRFQYWRASWQMVLEYPWFGVGPGNFQSLYERFRELSTTEQIAEPHNLFIETLASGGFVALGLLISILGAGVFYCVCQMRGSDVVQAGTKVEPAVDSKGDKWIVFGGAFAFILVWWLGLASPSLLDVEASMLVVPVVLVTAFAIWPFMRNLGSREIDSIVLSGCVGVGIHLLVAGGWTVPGVALLLWVGGGLLTRYSVAPVARDENSTKELSFACRYGRACSVVIAFVGSLACVNLFHYSIEPVAARKGAMARAAGLLQDGRVQQARRELLIAASADTWSPEAMLWLANLEQLQLTRRGESADLRRSWDAALVEALERAGEDPAAYRLVASQRLHLYQLYGQAADLEAATEIFEQVARWSPADEWVMAQMSVLETVRERPVEAAQYADKARELAVLGGNIERSLSRQLIFVPQKVGTPAQAGPVRRPADQLLNLQAADPSSDQQVIAEPITEQ